MPSKRCPTRGLFTTLKNGTAVLALFAIALPLLRSRGGSFKVTRRDFGWLTLIGIVGGSVPFLLFFTGLSLATAPTAAVIQKTLFVWVALLAVPFLGERLGLVQIGALGVLLANHGLIGPSTRASRG